MTSKTPEIAPHHLKEIYNAKGGDYGRRTALAASPSSWHKHTRGAKVPRSGWGGGTYNNNNDHNVLMLCTMSCETNENFRQENLASALNGEELVD